MKKPPSSRVALKKYTKNWLMLIEHIPYPISIHDTNYGIIMANGSFYDMCGGIEKIGSEKCYKIFHCRDSAVEHCPMSKTIAQKKPKMFELYECKLKKHLIIITAPILYRRKLIGIIHSITDISQIKKTQENYKKLINIYANSINKLSEHENTIFKDKGTFFDMLESAYKQLKELFDKFILAMVNALDEKSPWTKGHSENVVKYTEMIATEMNLSKDVINTAKLAGLLHDIGKIGTYDYLLNKPDKLLKSEFEIVKKHPDNGTKILKGIDQLNKVIPLIKHHHERYDGTGYPDGLKGEEIPLCARILHLADSFDAMMTDRPYRKAPGLKFAVSELNKYSGSQFDPEIVKVFIKILSKKKKKFI